MLDNLRGNSDIFGQCLARAIYDNIADAPDELPFRKGEMLTVLEQNTGGLEGWWLCSLKGMQGICPGNRLRLLPGRNKLHSHSLSQEQLSLSNSTTKKVVTPKRVGDVYLYGASRPPPNPSLQNYDTPPNCTTVANSSFENYDSPRATQTEYDSPRPLYDIPKSSQTINEAGLTCLGIQNESFAADDEGEEYDVPRPQADRTSKISHMSADSHFTSMLSSSPRTGSSLPSLAFSTASLSLYDVPRDPKQITQAAKPRLPPREKNSPQRESGQAHLRDDKSDVVYDIPPQVSREQQPPCVDIMRRHLTDFDPSDFDLEAVGDYELPLELNSAKDALAQLEQECYISVEKFVAAKPHECKTAMLVLKYSLDEILNFARGSVGNAMKEGNDALSKKICQLMDPLKAVYYTMTFEFYINCTQLNVPTSLLNLQREITAKASTVNDDVRHLSNTIQAHSHLIFKRSPIISTADAKNTLELARSRKIHSTTTSSEKCINTETDLSSSKKDSRNVSQLYENGQVEAVCIAQMAVSSPGDKQVLNFYGAQAKLHLQNMNAAIDSFLLTIENNQPPKVFIAHSKLVILAAHRMVYIGDTTHRNVSDSGLRKAIIGCSNGLCDSMRSTVLLTKTAALQFPSVSAVQAMVDAFVSISHLASNLKTVICGQYV